MASGKERKRGDCGVVEAMWRKRVEEKKVINCPMLPRRVT